jgi:hypothetical protein
MERKEIIRIQLGGVDQVVSVAPYSADVAASEVVGSTSSSALTPGKGCLTPSDCILEEECEDK